MIKASMTETASMEFVSVIGILYFGFVSYFDIRISYFDHKAGSATTYCDALGTRFFACWYTTARRTTSSIDS